MAQIMKRFQISENIFKFPLLCTEVRVVKITYPGYPKILKFQKFI